MVSIIQVMKGIIYFTIGLLLTWLIPFKMGSLIINVFGTNTIVTIGRWLVGIVTLILVPVILFTNSNIADKIENSFWGANK